MALAEAARADARRDGGGVQGRRKPIHPRTQSRHAWAEVDGADHRRTTRDLVFGSRAAITVRTGRRAVEDTAGRDRRQRPGGARLFGEKQARPWMSRGSRSTR